MEHATVCPAWIDRVDRFRSAPEVPTDPVATIVAASDFRIAKYPAVPEAAADAGVIGFAVAVTVPVDAVADGNAVAENVSCASSVPVTAPFRAGWLPV